MGGLWMFPLLVAWAGPTAPATALDEVTQVRPYGKVMGDGLNLTSEPTPPLEAVCAPGETVFGIDVSYYQGSINWQAVADSGVKFAIVRVSHSTQFFDPEFYNNLEGARAAGIHTGVYQYFEPDEDPVAQADLLLDSLGPLMPGDLPPMIDVESTGGQSPAAITSAIHAWIDRVEGELGVKPLIYTGYYFWKDNVGSTDFGDYPLVVAWYGVECPGNIPSGWDMWTIHQYCDCGNVSGIAGNVDVNRFNGSLADLGALGSMPECGDDACNGGEDPYVCPEDCPPCGVVPADGGVIDNGSDCYQLHGDDAFWREEPQGEGGSLLWTHATDYAEVYNYAVWELHFAESGRYDLSVHVVQPFGETTQAAYQVRHAEGDSTVAIDQSANDGWVSLGEFEFDVGLDQSLRLDDNTGESPDDEVMIVYDAIRLVRLDAQSSGTGESGGGTSGDSDGESGTTGDVPGTTGALSGPLADTGDDGGCGCRSTPTAAGHFGLLCLLGALIRRRRNSLSFP